MAPKRLSETEKQEIADRYRQPDESTATLSRAFGVSTSTIGRLLKNSFSADEYETLVQQKRLIGRGGATRSSTAKSAPELHPESNPQSGADATASETASSTVAASPASGGKPQRAAPKLRSRTRSRSRSRTSVSSTDSIATADDNDAQLGLSLESNHKTHEI
ncbi:MAG: helix-turn-helix domain-containing protein [Coleofasciculaceae cyanobacterium RL_1_1]|nr:helix-turn-helix domain-containing protein [Coleofasciculaceae cyanobacterium RL_1_1]